MKAAPKNSLYLALACLALLLKGLLPQAFAAENPLISSNPTEDPAETTIWPNQTSRANSDPWLVENHERLREMRPRVLVVNFHNKSSRAKLEKMIGDLFAAITESSRYHGYADAQAPAFLNYRLAKLVDLREPENTNANSGKIPLKPAKGKELGKLDYNAFFSQDYAKNYGYEDPKQPGRYLRLDELVDQGFVHEVWFMADQVKGFGVYESVEEKPIYTERFARIPGKFVQAGNGGDSGQKWTGRSVRIGFINVTRGIGCFLESLSHSFEGTSSSKAIPYFTKYFEDYAGYNLKKKWGLPFNTFYDVPYDRKRVEYPAPDELKIQWKEQAIVITNYLATAGNVHWPPNARGHYDLENTNAVLSTIEDWRIGSGAQGADVKKPFTNAAFARYRKMAPDCMGAWLIYWRQNMPGLDNLQKDDTGKPMKNWWPFLFY